LAWLRRGQWRLSKLGEKVIEGRCATDSAAVRRTLIIKKDLWTFLFFDGEYYVRCGLAAAWWWRRTGVRSMWGAFDGGGSPAWARCSWPYFDILDGSRLGGSKRRGTDEKLFYRTEYRSWAGVGAFWPTWGFETRGISYRDGSARQRTRAWICSYEG